MIEIKKYVCYAVDKGNGEIFSDFFKFDNTDSGNWGMPFNHMIIDFVTVADPEIRNEIYEFVNSNSLETKSFKGNSGRIYHFRIKERLK